MGKLYLLCFVFLSLSGAEHCPFCDSTVLEYQQIYESELTRALYTHKPVTTGHCLIIPKRHVERYEELTDEEMIQIFHTIQKVDQVIEQTFGTRPYMLLQKNGAQVGQTVSHIHFHYIPRKESDTSRFSFLIQMLPRGWFPPISSEEMHAMVEQLKPAFTR